MRALPIAVATTVTISLAAAGPALAGKGHVTDPSGDLPDVLRLDYKNAKSKVKMKMRYASLVDAQNQSFYMRWRKKSYQVFYSPSIDMTELRYYKNKTAEAKAVTCSNLAVTEIPAKESTKVVVPRTCIKKAPDKLKFQGIVTLGLTNSDETSVSPKVKRG